MNRIEIEVMKPAAALETFEQTWRRAQSGEDTVPRLAFDSLNALFSAITEKRLELLRHVAGHEGLNTRQLAQALGRDYKNIHTDVAALTGLGLLERDARGALSAPFDEIVIHAQVRDSA